MALAEKVKRALTRAFHPEYVHVEDDDGVTGYVVDKIFRRMSHLDRQTKIDKALRSESARMTDKELRNVQAIAAYTPEEAAAHGIRRR